MPATVIDWHKLIRAAVKAAAQAAFAAEEVTLDGGFKEMDFLTVGLTDIPAVAVTYGSTEQITGGGTNRRDDMEFPILLSFFSLQPDQDEDADDPPGCTATMFRAIVRETFHNRRAITLGTPGLYLFPSTVQPVPTINNEQMPAVENLQSAMLVTVPARVPRGTV